jgi:hypothetical protein
MLDKHEPRHELQSRTLQRFNVSTFQRFNEPKGTRLFAILQK